MNIIVKNRGMGKTWDIVKRSIETGYPILCFYKSDEIHYRDIARQQGFDPKKLKVIVCNNIDENFTGQMVDEFGELQKYIIDEAESFFMNLLVRYTHGQIKHIDTIYINYENIVNVNYNKEKIRESISYLLDLYSNTIKDKNCDYGKALNILKNVDMLRGQIKE
nr:MAG TPA: hypothetical protein [Caudoviricetes sp.]